jgi:hypothetical protein
MTRQPNPALRDLDQARAAVNRKPGLPKIVVMPWVRNTS